MTGDLHKKGNTVEEEMSSMKSTRGLMESPMNSITKKKRTKRDISPRDVTPEYTPRDINDRVIPEDPNESVDDEVIVEKSKFNLSRITEEKSAENSTLRVEGSGKEKLRKKTKNEVGNPYSE